MAKRTANDQSGPDERTVAARQATGGTGSTGSTVDQGGADVSSRPATQEQAAQVLQNLEGNVQPATAPQEATGGAQGTDQGAGQGAQGETTAEAGAAPQSTADGRQIGGGLRVPQKFVDAPRRYQLEDGTWVGVGGSITMRGRAPHYREYTVPEATEAQYGEIARVNNYLVSKSEQ